MGIFTTSAPATGTAHDDAVKPLPPALQKALSKVTEVGALPEVTVQIVHVVEDPDATARDIQEVVQADPALATKLLKVVNSAFYGLPSQIASLDRAILMLGLNVVKNLALATSLTKLLKAEPISKEFGPRDLWRHCIAVGVGARQIAELTRVAQRDEAFVAGLVHDLGLIVLQQVAGNEMSQVAETCYREPQNYCDVEQQLIGADHQVVGAALANKWKFPVLLRNAVGYHHDPSALQPEYQKVATAVYVADTLSSRARLGYWLPAQTQEISDWMVDLLALTPDQITQLTEQLPQLLEEAEAIFAEG